MDKVVPWLCCLGFLLAGCASPAEESWPEPEEPLSDGGSDVSNDKKPAGPSEPATYRKEAQYNGTLDNTIIGCWFSFSIDGMVWHDIDPWMQGGSYEVEFQGDHLPVNQPGIFDEICVYIKTAGSYRYNAPTGQIPDDADEIAVSADGAISISYELKIWNDVPINGTSVDG